MSSSLHTSESSQKSESVQQKITNIDSALQLSSDDEETESEITNAEEIETNQNKTEIEDLPTEFSHTAESTAIHNTKNSCANTRDDLSVSSSKLHHVGGSKVICSNPTVDRNDDFSIGSPADDDDVKIDDVSASKLKDDGSIDSDAIDLDNEEQPTSKHAPPINIKSCTFEETIDTNSDTVDNASTVRCDDALGDSVFTFPLQTVTNDANSSDPFQGSFQSVNDQSLASYDGLLRFTTNSNQTIDASNDSQIDDFSDNNSNQNEVTDVPPTRIQSRSPPQTMEEFRARYEEENQDKWQCRNCTSFNSNSDMVCATKCGYSLDHENARTEPILVAKGRDKREERNIAHLQCFEELTQNRELLHYDVVSHPVPKYFPYQHEEREEELDQEGDEAWTQFDDSGSDEDDEDEDVNMENGKEENDSDSNEDERDDLKERDNRNMKMKMVETYRKYKIKRCQIKEQLARNMGRKSKDIAIAVAGDGSMSGALGLGNGDVTPIHLNIATFPFLLTSMLGKKIKCIAAGIMSTAVVTLDDELYVWGLNDKSELTINPYNLAEVDVGCDDDQISPIKDILQRKSRTLNDSESVKDGDEAMEVDNSNHDPYRPYTKRNSSKELRQKEDADQSELACSYWTPAHIRMPFKKMVIKQVTLGGTHMVVLDNVGRVFSSGTFSNDGPIGHHFDEEKDEVIRYQRELKQITNIEFIKNGDSNRRAANQNALPPIKAIASGANHVLMLDDHGNVYQMGVVKLGQRWSDRNIKKYLSPQRITLVDDKARPKERIPFHSMDTLRIGQHLYCRRDGRWQKGIVSRILSTKICIRFNRGTHRHVEWVESTDFRNKLMGIRRAGRKKVTFTKIACGNHHNLAISSDGQLYSWGQNVWLQCGHPKDQCGHGNSIDIPKWVPFYRTKQDVNDETEENEMVDYRIRDVVAGEHMTVALDEDNNVWTCGRNACNALGRKTRDEGMKMIDGREVKTEVHPDLMRKVPDLRDVDWIGCGSVVWFAHNKFSGAVYAFGDASNGRAGIGEWKYARGRPVFDEYNLDLSTFQVTSATGGCDHAVFTIKKQRVKRRNSEVPILTTNLKESLRFDTITDVSTARKGGNQKREANDVKKASINARNPWTIAASARTRKKTKRKRSRGQMEIPALGSLVEVSDEETESEPPTKKPRLARQNVGVAQSKSLNLPKCD